MKQEVELKLELAPGDADAFERLALLPVQSDVATTHAIYFDTPGRDLEGHGVSLRIRRSGKKRVQTVKADGSGNGGGAGLFARAEWEMPVKADVPVLDARTPVLALLGEAVHEIEPVFHVDVERRSWTTMERGAEIELVLDRGTVGAAGRQAAVCEIELELKSGEPLGLFALARLIDGEIPVRLGVVTKAERGYRLRDALAQAAKAEPVALEPGMTSGEAFAGIAANCLRHYRLNEALLLDRYDAKALHQARVAIRRLRSAFWLFKPMLAEADVARFQSELKWLAGILGEARDLDVLAQQEDLRERLEAAQVQTHERVRQWLTSARVRALLIDLVEWLTLGAGEGDRSRPAADFAAERLRRLRKRIVKGGEHLAKLSDEERHAVRKDAKKLRYASEFFTDLFDGKKRRRRQEKFVAALEEVQTGLGALNDLVAAPGLLAQYGLADEARVRPKKKRKLVAQAAKAHAALVEAPRFW